MDREEREKEAHAASFFLSTRLRSLPPLNPGSLIIVTCALKVHHCPTPLTTLNM